MSLLQLQDLPELDPSEFNEGTDYLVVQKINGATYKQRATNIFNNQAGKGFTWFPSAVQMMHLYSSQVGVNTHSIADLVGDDNPYSLLISIYHIGRAYPSATFYYYTSPTSPTHTVNINYSRTDQDLQEMLWVPISDKNMYWGLGLGGSLSPQVKIYAHAYLS